MNTDTGEIKMVDSADSTEGRLRLPWVAISEREAAFFRAKGAATRALWGKRMARGLTVAEREQLDAMIETWEGR